MTAADCPICTGDLDTPLLHARDRLYGLPGTFSIARCRACGAGVTLPRVDAAQLALFYPTAYGAYDGLRGGILGHVSRLVQGLLAWRALSSAPLARICELAPGRLLDVGCGRGDLGGWLVARGWSVVGVEPSRAACAVARERGVDARAGALGEAELEPGTFDVVVFRHSLEHVADPVADLRRTRELLRSGGVAIVSVPNFGCWQRARFGDRWLHLDVPRHRVHFDVQSLRAAFARAGFARVETCTTSSVVAVPASVQYAIFGRCLFPSGIGLRLAIAACALTAPLSSLADRLAGGGDVLHALARA